MPAKAISPARDHLQSLLLIAVSVPAFACLLALATLYAQLMIRSAPLTAPAYLFRILVISLVFALAAWRLRAATPLAAVFGGIICLILTLFTSPPYNTSPLHTALTPLLVLFLLTFGATRLGRKRKQALGTAESRRGRNASQILANLGIAAIAGSVWYFTPVQLRLITRPILWIWSATPALAALAEATADTVSSEIGQAFGGTPRMLLTLRPVPPGTDGAISLIGTAAGIAGAAIIAALGVPALGLDIRAALIAFAAAVAGLFFDTLLGATLERRGWIGNDLVNLSSTLFAAVLATLFA